MIWLNHVAASSGSAAKKCSEWLLGKETDSCMKDPTIRFPVTSMDCHWACINKAITVIAPDHSWSFHFERKFVVDGWLKCQQKFAISWYDFLLLQKRRTVVGLQFWPYFWTFCWKVLSEPLMCTIKFFHHILGEDNLTGFLMYFSV